MSVYIKGFPLPNNCGACPLRLAWCRERIYMVTRPERCPLVPVPEHGRLIDADALGTPGTIEEDTLWRGRIETEVYLASTIYNAPTVIPADKEGEG